MSFSEDESYLSKDVTDADPDPPEIGAAETGLEALEAVVPGKPPAEPLRAGQGSAAIGKQNTDVNSEIECRYRRRLAEAAGRAMPFFFPVWRVQAAPKPESGGG